VRRRPTLVAAAAVVTTPTVRLYAAAPAGDAAGRMRRTVDWVPGVADLR